MEHAKHSEDNWRGEGPLYPIDETHDLQDPFSDLSLFLAQKIKGEVTKFGGVGKWSSQIQSQLLEKILPEFRRTFPKHRLGVSALRKMWEKVAFYYGKVHGQRDALRGDGKLNVAFMIRENLKHCQAHHLPSSLPPYHAAHQIAVKISECITTLDGEKPNVEDLTRLVWVAQKHIVKNLPAQRAKNAFEEYTVADKIIVKTQLETLAETPLISQSGLQAEVTKRVKEIHRFTKERSNEMLYSTVAKALAREKLSQITLTQLPAAERKQIEAFIKRQISLCTLEEDREECIYIEAIQRILALYPLASALPKHFDEGMIREAIEMTYSLLCGETEEMTIPLDHATYAFINAEIHFLSRKEAFGEYEDLENCIVETLKMCTALPEWQDQYINELEIVVWASCKKERGRKLLRNEVTSSLLDAGHLSFQGSVYRIIDFFQRASRAIAETGNLEDKIALWSHQNDMVCRALHFDHKTPLYQLILGKWGSIQEKEAIVDHHAFVDSVYRTFISRFPVGEELKESVKNRIWTLYKFMWYSEEMGTETTSLDRFLAWHTVRLRRTGCIDRENVRDALEALLTEALPLLPLPKELATPEKK